MESIETLKENLPDHMKPASEIGAEISITGKWIPSKKGVLFLKSEESKEMRSEWNDIHEEVKTHNGILSTEINHAIGQDAVLIHHVFDSEESLLGYFDNTASQHSEALLKVARPETQLIRGIQLSEDVRNAIGDKAQKSSFGEYLFGYVKHDYQQPNPEHAIQVTAKWTCKPGENIEELAHWWMQVGKDAYEMEEGLVRFEVFQVIGEDALIIHETFTTNEELKFHLSKGTAAKYKKEIDGIAFPEDYFFRGPVSWMIRTYSKFMSLPATYSSQGKNYTHTNGSMSDGRITSNTNTMKKQEVMVVYKWTAKEGKSEALKSIYNEVAEQMQTNEPGALNVQCYFDDSSSTLVVMDLFADAGAVGFHLGTTAAGHFENLLEIAVPGEFLFCGEVPEEMKQAAVGMGLNATFAPNIFGFERALTH